jgi:sec-independent protein translocase protein TatA
MVIVGVIAVLLFGERLPEVSKKVGKHLMDLKKGVRDIQDQISSAVNTATSTSSTHGSESYADGTHITYEDLEEHEEASAPKFEPPPSDPIVQTPPSTPPSQPS